VAFIAIFLQSYLVSPSFAIPSSILNWLLKTVPILADCVLGIVLYAGVRGVAGERPALGAALAYLFNPAILFASAYWGMFGDSMTALLLVLTLLAACRRRMALAWVALTAGVFFKPQAAAVVPLLVWITVRSKPSIGWLRAGLAAALTAAAIWLPFLIAGTLPQAIAALRQTVGLFPDLSVNAHNLWWAVTLGHGQISDVRPLLGPIPGRTLGLIGFGAIYAFALYRLEKTPDREMLFPVAAYLAFGFFMFSTQMHENYLFPAVTFLALAYWQSRTWRVVGLLLTVTWLANMALHDPLLWQTGMFSRLPGAQLGIANAVLNCLIFVGWTAALIRGKGGLENRAPAAGDPQSAGNVTSSRGDRAASSAV
jgi:Gpi18-like mannosyltransferase